MITADSSASGCDTLPSLPTTVLALGHAVADDRCTVDRIMGILAQDLALSAALLRLANSVMYVRDDRVMDLRSAVMRLGFDASSTWASRPPSSAPSAAAATWTPWPLWQHSVAVGLVAKGICALAGQGRTRTPRT